MIQFRMSIKQGRDKNETFVCFRPFELEEQGQNVKNVQKIYVKFISLNELDICVSVRGTGECMLRKVEYKKNRSHVFKGIKNLKVRK